MRVVVVGATGLIGGAVFKLLAAQDGVETAALVRRPLDTAGAALQQVVAATDTWADRMRALSPDVLVCTLGTTIRTAGSQQAFAAIDRDLVLATAQAARDNGARRMVHVSSVGADAGSRNFYLRTKGQVEQALRGMGFDRLDILQPGLLRPGGLSGPRRGPARHGEALALVAAPVSDALLHGALRRYRSIAAADVARAAVALAQANGTGVHVHQHDSLRQWAGSAAA